MGSTLDYVPTYRDLAISTSLGDATVHYIGAGRSSDPTILLLHGFPSSSDQFRELIPLLSDEYHVLAPDLPGFGLTTVSSGFAYTFDDLTIVIAAWLPALNITRFVPYLFDYGAAVGLRLAVENPSQVPAIITQSGNAYYEGFGEPFWEPIMALWNETDPNSNSARDSLRNSYLTLAGTQYQYLTGVPDADLKLINPTAAIQDYFQNLAGNSSNITTDKQNVQLDLFYDYRTNVPFYDVVHDYFRKTQVPLLAAWGRGDPAFIPPGAEAYKRDLQNAEIHLLDGGHFLLETQRWEVARLIRSFLARVELQGVAGERRCD